MSEVILRLSSAFVALCEAGDVKYLKWKKEIRCDIEACKLNGGNIMEQFREEVASMELRCHEWETYLIELRQKHQELNFYTVKQILHLQREISYLSSDCADSKLISAQVFTLLKYIDPEITSEKVKQAYYLSCYVDSSLSSKDWTAIESEFENFCNFSIEELKSFVDVLQNDHLYEENVAMASLVAVTPFTKSSAVLWCEKQDSEEPEIDELCSKAVNEFEKFELYDTTSAKETTASQQDQISEMSLDQLCLFLVEVQAMAAKHQKRIVPSFLHKDKPNLIVLPKDIILSSVLYFYLESSFLPRNHEVLICSEDTKLEEIKIFFLRALSDLDGLYCMAFINRINYINSEKALRFLCHIMTEKIYNLILLCSKETENLSYLAAALDSHQVHLPQNFNAEKLTTFVHSQIRVNSDEKNCLAAHVDQTNSYVRVVESRRSGMGKTLFVNNCGSKLESYMSTSQDCKFRMKRCQQKDTVVTIPIHSVEVNTEKIVNRLLEYEEKEEYVIPRIYHFDIAPVVSMGIDEFIFKLTMLGALMSSNGKLWKQHKSSLCLIEITHPQEKEIAMEKGKSVKSILEMLPLRSCSSPTEAYKSLQSNVVGASSMCDEMEFKGCPIQRVCQYLNNFSINPASVNKFVYKQENPPLDMLTCLQALLKYCGLTDPSWMELRNFVHFFNIQLSDSESSVFTLACFDEDLRGFKAFVVKFMLEMSKDFATRSLNLHEILDRESGNFLLEQHKLQRRWEKIYHPYLFFNQDHTTMTFLGFCISRNGDLIDPKTHNIIQPNIMTPDLYTALQQQMREEFVQLTMNFSKMSRQEKLLILCRVMGMDEYNFVDPDPTYELNADNMKKMLAIHMRLRCGIPVVLMGETGCGKTRLIKFMCAFKAGSNQICNMILVKVHGGVAEKDIENRVEEAVKLAEYNNLYYEGLSTVLFFDEANTTSAIGLIKEIMVDKKMYGISLKSALYNLEIIAACNPYRRHSKEMIVKLDTAGLGYHVSAEKTYDKIGDIPLRELVYRVHPLPDSMLPLVWDFGQLDNETESSYARQIVLQYVQRLDLSMSFADLLVRVLLYSQEYMRKQKDECSFVSLRDVERAVQVTVWFYKKMPLLKIISQKQKNISRTVFDTPYDVLSLLLAISVCYVARLENRDPYLAYILSNFADFLPEQNNIAQYKYKVSNCQLLFVNELDLEPTIARNEALCENIFMMVICIELRIPLFVVGKPGSSKSLAKTIIQDSMQGSSSKSELFQNFKQIFMSSYQCSPLSTAEGIIGTFRQCSRFQENKDLETFASVVVLDEVGLAEDSPKMPLKALHPLLEDGSDGSEDLTTEGAELKNKRVAFIGISNWSLDPAKMNRGIMLCRGDPDIKELTKTAMDICSSDPRVKSKIEHIIPLLSKSYDTVCKIQRESEILQRAKKEEFFALRDFYSLIKMIFTIAKEKDDTPSELDVELCVKRNFSGLNDVSPWETFKHNLRLSANMNFNFSTVELIRSSFLDVSSNSRYLLVMTEEYAAYNILLQTVLKGCNDIVVIFGSSFPKDQEFTQICRDINKIKICMETGRSVILLNMENLYESLYDVLNQYYVYLGGEQFVDLGLGTHRVKCKVSKKFKLIVIADKNLVYESYPIPLINRLEKHFLITSTSMSVVEQELTDQLKQWASSFASFDSYRKSFGPVDVFMGYNEDMCASIVMSLLKKENFTNYDVIQRGREILLQIATPDSVARAAAKFQEDKDDIMQSYFYKQHHDSLLSFLEAKIDVIDTKTTIIQVTTFSRLFSSTEISDFCLADTFVAFLSLVQFQTEQSFREAIKIFLGKEKKSKSLLIIQCNNAAENSNLVACAQHICIELRRSFYTEEQVFILFLLQLGYKKSGFKVIGVSQQTCTCVHIDELRKPCLIFPSLIDYVDKPLSNIFDICDHKHGNQGYVGEDEVDEKIDQTITDIKKAGQAASIITSCLQESTKELSNINPMLIGEITDLIKTTTTLLSCDGN